MGCCWRALRQGLESRHTLLHRRPSISYVSADPALSTLALPRAYRKGRGLQTRPSGDPQETCMRAEA